MIEVVNQGLEMVSVMDLNFLTKATDIVNSFDVQYFSQVFDMMDLNQLTKVSNLIVEKNNLAPIANTFNLSADQVTPFLTTITTSAEGIRKFVAEVLETFFPFAYGGAVILSSIKFVAAGFKTLLGRAREAIEDFKWVCVGVAIMAILPTLIDSITDILLGNL